MQVVKHTCVFMKMEKIQEDSKQMILICLIAKILTSVDLVTLCRHFLSYYMARHRIYIFTMPNNVVPFFPSGFCACFFYRLETFQII